MDDESRSGVWQTRADGDGTTVADTVDGEVAIQSISPDEAVSHAVVTAIADTLDVDPVEMQPPLYEVVDPDALDELFASNVGGDGLYVAFAYNGCEVSISGDGRVSVVEVCT